MQAKDDERWPYEEDRCYHGVQVGHAAADAKVFVELTEYGWTDRKEVVTLRELEADYLSADFNWGYVGTGTNATAKAILQDALGGEPNQQMLLDFGEDVLSQAPSEFRLRRGAVLRWARGWAAQRHVADLPEVLESLPPVDRSAFGRRPPKSTLRGDKQ